MLVCHLPFLREGFGSLREREITTNFIKPLDIIGGVCYNLSIQIEAHLIKSIAQKSSPEAVRERDRCRSFAFFGRGALLAARRISALLSQKCGVLSHKDVFVAL